MALQQRNDGEVVLPEETDLHGATDEKAAQPADDGPGELEGEALGSGEVVLPDEEPGLYYGATEEEAEDVSVELEGGVPGSGEVVLPDEVEEPVLHGATAEEVVRPATEEADDVPVELEAGGWGEETPWPEKQKFKSLKAVVESSSAEDQEGKATDAPRAEEELPAGNFAGEVLVVPTVDPEEVVSLRARLAATEAENLRNKETVIELEKRLKEMSLSAADSSGSGTKSEQLPAAAAGRGHGKQQKEKGKAPAAAGAGRAAKPLMTAAVGGKPDAEEAHERRSGRGRVIQPNTRYSSDEFQVHGDAAVAWKGKGQGRR